MKPMTARKHRLIRRLATPLSAVVCALFATTSWATIPAQLSGDEIESLIKELVSPNEAPTKLAPSARFPQGYDRDAQKRVMTARKKLVAAGIQAFPHLFNHFWDGQYSFTGSNGFVDANWTVGKACIDIIKCHVQPFGYFPYAIPGKHAEPDSARKRPLRPSYAAHHKLSNPEEARNWLESRQQKTLLELQIESIEWTIAEEAKRPDDYSDGERKYLNGYLERAREATEPLPPAYPFPK
jgi:hypothetical protein